MPDVWLQRRHKHMNNSLTCEDMREVAVPNGRTINVTLRTMNGTAATDRARHLDECECAPCRDQG